MIEDLNNGSSDFLSSITDPWRVAADQGLLPKSVLDAAGAGDTLDSLLTRQAWESIDPALARSVVPGESLDAAAARYYGLSSYSWDAIPRDVANIARVGESIAAVLYRAGVAPAPAPTTMNVPAPPFHRTEPSLLQLLGFDVAPPPPPSQGTAPVYSSFASWFTRTDDASPTGTVAAVSPLVLVGAAVGLYLLLD